MDWKNDEVLKTLIEKGKQSGSLTFDEVNAALPEMAEPDRLAEITEYLLDTHGVSLIDGDDEDDAPVPVTAEALIADAEVASAFEDSDGDGRHIDDPVRMYLTQMGEIPLLDRASRKSRSPRRSKSPASASAARCWSATTPCAQVVETLKRVHTGDLPFDRTMKVSRPRTWRRTRSSRGCRTTCGRSNR